MAHLQSIEREVRSLGPLILYNFSMNLGKRTARNLIPTRVGFRDYVYNNGVTKESLTFLKSNGNFTTRVVPWDYYHFAKTSEDAKEGYTKLINEQIDANIAHYEAEIEHLKNYRNALLSKLAKHVV